MFKCFKPVARLSGRRSIMWINKNSPPYWPFEGGDNREVSPEQFKELLDMRGKEDVDEPTKFKVLDVRFEHERDYEDLNKELVVESERINLAYGELDTGLYDFDLPKDQWILCLC